MVGVVGAGVGNIVEDVVSREAEPLGRGQQPLGPKGALGVNVEALSLGPSHVYRKLASYGHRVTQLRFARPEMLIADCHFSRFHGTNAHKLT